MEDQVILLEGICLKKQDTNVLNVVGEKQIQQMVLSILK